MTVSVPWSIYEMAENLLGDTGHHCNISVCFCDLFVFKTFFFFSFYILFLVFYIVEKGLCLCGHPIRVGRANVWSKVSATNVSNVFGFLLYPQGRVPNYISIHLMLSYSPCATLMMGKNVPKMLLEWF